MNISNNSNISAEINSEELEIRTKINSKSFYIIGCISDGFISQKIKQFSPSWIPESRRWSHVAVLFWDKTQNNFQVIESHFETGVYKIAFRDWLEKNKNKICTHIVEYKNLSLKKLESFLGQKYGIEDIKYLEIEPLINREFKNKNSEGIYCSELIFMSDNGFFERQTGIKAHKSRPVDIQEFIFLNKRECFDFNLTFPTFGLFNKK